MLRAISLVVVGLSLAHADLAQAEEPFSNQIALDAQKRYEEAIENAKKEYAAQLEIAIKDAGGAGDLEEASRLDAEKKRIEGTDPLTQFRRRLIGSKWHSDPNNARSWNQFNENNESVTFEGVRYAWFATSEDTVIYQNPRNLNIWVWHFDDALNTAVLHQFTKSGTVVEGKRVR